MKSSVEWDKFIANLIRLQVGSKFYQTPFGSNHRTAIAIMQSLKDTQFTTRKNSRGKGYNVFRIS